jgi:UDP-N-acetylmuramoyl-tripeptide--D-alanyl-D-alanine ligase
LVPNTLLALQDLARAWRRELGLPIIAITGTNGKTTTKELLATVLSTKYNIHYTQGNLNNQIGVPLTLFQITRAHEMAIVEMGASHPGDIKELVEIAEPNFGLITNVGRAHLEGFGSFEGVQRTKQELYDYLLAHNGTIFRNADNPFLAAMENHATQLYTTLPHATQLPPHATQLYTTGSMPSGTHLVGEYNAENVSAAICMGEHFGISPETALDAIRQYVPTNNRSQAMQTASNQLIVDAYNANPTSMQAAINAFKGDTYILGAMRELGEYSHLEHQNIVNMLAERKADTVFLVGEEYRQTTSPYPIFDRVEDLHKYLDEHPLKDRNILLKGSRSTKMEFLLDIL